MSDKETVSEADDKLAKADVAGNRWTPERIKALRVSRGWSQEELGRRLGRSRQTAWEWENGVTLPGDLSARALDALAAGEDVTTVVRERPAVVYGASPVLLGRAQEVEALMAFALERQRLLIAAMSGGDNSGEVEAGALATSPAGSPAGAAAR